MGDAHTGQEILDHLLRGSLGTLATCLPEDGPIRQRVMYYGVDDDFTFYLMSTRGSPKIDHILGSPRVSFLIFNLEDPYDASWEAEITGQAALIQDGRSVKKALLRLKENNPFAEVALESGITDQFTIIGLRPSLIRFRIYGEALRGVPPSMLSF